MKVESGKLQSFPNEGSIQQYFIIREQNIVSCTIIVKLFNNYVKKCCKTFLKSQFILLNSCNNVKFILLFISTFCFDQITIHFGYFLHFLDLFPKYS
jgi:hypothetical protein